MFGFWVSSYGTVPEFNAILIPRHIGGTIRKSYYVSCSVEHVTNIDRTHFGLVSAWKASNRCYEASACCAAALQDFGALQLFPVCAVYFRLRAFCCIGVSKDNSPPARLLLGSCNK